MAGDRYRGDSVEVRMYAAFAPAPPDCVACVLLLLDRVALFRAATRFAATVTFSRPGSGVSSIPKTTRNCSLAASKRALNCRPVLGAMHFATMSERRSGVREYSEERARRISFLIGWSLLLLLELSSSESEPESEGTEEGGEERRRWGGRESEGWVSYGGRVGLVGVRG